LLHNVFNSISLIASKPKQTMNDLGKCTNS
jgi:hypothetical protein